jgi:hypothetical protein
VPKTDPGSNGGQAPNVAQTRVGGDPPKRHWAELATAATAIITIVAAAIYGLGAVSLGLKLWYIKDPVTPVLGQLPSSFLLVASFSYIIFPAILAGAVVYSLYHHLARHRPLLRSTKNSKPNIIYFTILPILLAGVPVGFVFYYYYIRKSLIVGVERSWWVIFVACLILSVISIYLAFRILLLVKNYERGSALSYSGIRRVLPGGVRVGIAALALTPCVSFASAAIPLPVVFLCGAAFHHVESLGHHYQVGNLIGTSGQWAYLAETKVRVNSKLIYTYTGNYIAVVPLSAVQLTTIGNEGGCDDLVPTEATEALNSGYYVSHKPNDKPDSRHWFILLTADPNGNTSGTIAFADRYGEPHLVQTFTGHAHSRFATLTFSKAGSQAAKYESTFISLNRCWKWLKHISNGSQCVFIRPSGS